MISLALSMVSNSALAGPRAISRTDAVRAAIESGPGVAVAGAATAAAADASRAAGRLPFPARLTVSAGPRFGRGDASAELGATVMQELPPSGLMDARRHSADALGAVVRADIERAKLDAVTRAAIAWISAAEARDIVLLRERGVKEAEQLVVLARARLRGGAISPIDDAAARGELGAARVALLDAEGSLIDALAELRLAMGIEANASIEPVGDLVADEGPVTPGPVLDQVETHPSVRAAAARARLARDDVTLSIRNASPGWSLGASYLREGTGDHVVMGMLAIPLPTVSPGLLEGARQRAQADMAAAQVSLARAQAERDLMIANHDREHSRETHRALVDGALGPIREAANIAQKQYEAGTTDVTPVLIARQRRLSAEERVVRAVADIMRADVRHARASGTLRERGLP